MGRYKTISDDEVLRVARDVFRAQGHTATTRAVAEAAGISEAVLYQRFGSKDEMFFAAMHPTAPDVEEVLGPKDPPDDARKYLRTVAVRAAKYFSGVIPLALHIMTHPSFDRTLLAKARAGGPAALRDGLAERLASLARRGRIVTSSEVVTARLLVSLAHDWALGNVFQHDASAGRLRGLTDMVDVVWLGLRPRGK
jgi:AcrR family transcriptional regulator